MQRYLLQKKNNTPFFQKMSKEFGPDYDLMHFVDNNRNINLRNSQSWLKNQRMKFGNKLMGIKHNLLEIEIKMETWDPVNKKWILHKIIPGQSYNNNYAKIWYMLMTSQAGQSLENLTSVAKAWWVATTTTQDTVEEGWLNAYSDQTVNTIGTQQKDQSIVIGSSSTAFNLLDEDLTRHLTNWVYDETLISIDPTITGQNLDIVCTRLFRNKTGGALNVQEVGLIGHSEYIQNNIDEFLFERTLTGGFNVNDATTIRIQYTMRVSNA